MSETTAYLQFPLCALSFYATAFERFDHIISYGCVEAGIAKWNKLDEGARSTKLGQFISSKDTPRDFRQGLSLHSCAMIGAEMTKIKVGSVEARLKQWKDLSKNLSQYEARYKKDAEVRLTAPLIFEARDGAGITYRELSVYAAIVSIIGAKGFPVRITRGQIGCRALGYKSAFIMGQELANRKDGLTPLSLRQINYTLDKLDERRFFARSRANARQTFYSIRHDKADLEIALLKSKSYSQEFHEKRKLANQSLMKRIKEAKAPIKVDNTIKVDNAFVPSPLDVHSPSTGVSTTASTSLSTGVSTLIKTPLIETPVIETPLTETQLKETLPTGREGGDTPESNLKIKAIFAGIRSAVEAAEPPPKRRKAKSL